VKEYEGEGVQHALLALETTHRVILSGVAASRSEADIPLRTTKISA
jgi:hypothetical protein